MSGGVCRWGGWQAQMPIWAFGFSVMCRPFGRSVATYRCEVDVQHMIGIRSTAGLYGQHRRELMRFATTLVCQFVPVTHT